MRSSFAGLEMMRSALMVAQTAMDITGHNVANANTEGYSRQRVNIVSVSSANPFEKFNPLAVDVAGQGATTEGVERVRDEYLDGQFRNATSRQSRYQISAEGLSILEQSFQEMDDAGLYAAFGDLFDSFQDLANDPGSSEQMLLVRQQAIDLVDVFHRDIQQLDDAAQSNAERMDIRVDEANQLLENIANMNEEIYRLSSSGIDANDLMDKRGVMLDQLSSIINIRMGPSTGGMLQILVGSEVLIDHDTYRTLDVQQNLDDTYSLIWTDTGLEVADVNGGELAGCLDMLNGGTAAAQGGTSEGIPALRARFDAIATAVINEFNTLNNGGVLIDGSMAAGPDLFAGTSAEDISLSADWASSVWALAQSLNGDAGDNRNILNMLAFRDQSINFGFTQGSLEDASVAMTVELGSAVASADQLVQSSTLLKDAVDMQRQSLSSVSLDEEMINMVRYQQAYSAASRVITSMDEMLDTLINRTGIAGR